jgi:Protein kinase domain
MKTSEIRDPIDDKDGHCSSRSAAPTANAGPKRSECKDHHSAQQLKHILVRLDSQVRNLIEQTDRVQNSSPKQIDSLYRSIQDQLRCIADEYGNNEGRTGNGEDVQHDGGTALDRNGKTAKRMMEANYEDDYKSYNQKYLGVDSDSELTPTSRWALGSGAFGKVYYWKNSRTGKEVALKIQNVEGKDDPEFARAVKEGKIHLGVIGCHENIVLAECMYTVMCSQDGTSPTKSNETRTEKPKEHRESMTDVMAKMTIGSPGFTGEVRANCSDNRFGPPASVSFMSPDKYGKTREEKQNGSSPTSITTIRELPGKQNTVVLVTECCHGTLKELFWNFHNPGGPENVTIVNILNIFRGVINGVHYIHKKRIVHCDIKSENILYIKNEDSCENEGNSDDDHDHGDAGGDEGEGGELPSDSSFSDNDDDDDFNDGHSDDGDDDHAFVPKIADFGNSLKAGEKNANCFRDIFGMGKMFFFAIYPHGDIDDFKDGLIPDEWDTKTGGFDKSRKIAHLLRKMLQYNPLDLDPADLDPDLQFQKSINFLEYARDIVDEALSSFRAGQEKKSIQG